MWKAFDGSLVTTVCRSSLARKILCNNKCEGCWWEAEGGVHFSPFLLFFFSFLSVVLLLQSLAFIRWLRKATDQDRSGGARKLWKTPCAFSPIFGPLSPWMLFFDAQCQDRRSASHSSVIVGGTRSCFHPSWLRWGVWWELERMKMSLLSWKSLVPTVYSAFRQTLPWPGKMRTPELASSLRWWGCKARLTPVYRATECLNKSTGIQWKSSFKPEF